MRTKYESSGKIPRARAGTFIVAALTLMAACSSGGPAEDPPKIPSAYLGGSSGGQACYWDGRTRIDLPGIGTYPSVVKGIDANGGIVYSAGYYFDGSSRHACYWEGQARHELPGDGVHSAYARAIDVADGLVYTAGYYYDATKSIPCYWVGATRHNLPMADDSTGWACGIAVSGGTVYVCGGYSNNSTGTGACYWTDTVDEDATLTELLSGNPAVSIPSAYGICVSGESVYVIGSHYDESGEAPYRSHPCYWEDGELCYLADSPTLDSEALSIAVSGGIVHAVGYYTPAEGERSACYWNDSSRYDLPDNESLDSEATSISIGDDAVYVGGRYSGDTAVVACCWEGITRIDMPFEAGDENYVGAIAAE